MRSKRDLLVAFAITSLKAPEVTVSGAEQDVIYIEPVEELPPIVRAEHSHENKMKSRKGRNRNKYWLPS